MKARAAVLAVAGAALASGIGIVGTIPAFTATWYPSVQKIDVPCDLDYHGFPLPTLCMIDTGTSYDMMITPGLAKLQDAQPLGDPVRVFTFVGPQTLRRVGVQVTVGGQAYTAAAMVAPYWNGGPIIGLGLMERMGAMSVDWKDHTVTFSQEPQ